MTIEQAKEIKSILVLIKDHIPSHMVDRIFHYYKTHFEPRAIKPCTCSPKYWNQMLIKLRDKVELVLSDEQGN
jgi:hypothetical protein